MDLELPMRIREVLEKYDIVVEEGQIPIMKQYGLGDLLFMIILQKQGRLGVLNFNLIYFDRKYCDYFDNPVNALEFRIRLLLDFNAQVRYIHAPMSRLNSDIGSLVRGIVDYKCVIPSTMGNFEPIQEKYIIFHTKLRLGPETKHRISLVKKYVTEILIGFKSKYKIILLGERKYIINRTIDQSFMSTIYPELQCLKENNDILDLTDESIHNKLDYDRLKRSISIIRGGECNITFGWGGSFCLALIFGKKCITYIDQVPFTDVLDIGHLHQNNTYIHRDIAKFKENILKNYSV